MLLRGQACFSTVRKDAFFCLFESGLISTSPKTGSSRDKNRRSAEERRVTQSKKKKKKATDCQLLFQV